MGITASQAFQVNAIVSLSLWLKVLYSNLMLGGAKMKAGRRAPEDTYQMTADKVKPEAIADVDRAQRIVNNDIENIPYGLILGWISLFCATRNTTVDEALLTAQGVLIVVFGAMRIAHTIAYKFALSYARSIFWLGGVFAVTGLGIIAIIASFRT